MLNDTLGTGLIKWIGDKQYRLAPVTQEVRAVFEQYIAKCCLDSIKLIQPFLTIDQTALLLSAHSEKLASGAYDMWGSIGRSFLTEDRHIIHWLWVFLTPYEKVSKAEVENLFELHRDQMFQILVELVSKKNLHIES